MPDRRQWFVTYTQLSEGMWEQRSSGGSFSREQLTMDLERNSVSAAVHAPTQQDNEGPASCSSVRENSARGPVLKVAHICDNSADIPLQVTERNWVLQHWLSHRMAIRACENENANLVIALKFSLWHQKCVVTGKCQCNRLDYILIYVTTQFWCHIEN